MPMSSSFKDRLTPVLKDVAAHFGTPFHIYDETGIRETGAALKKAFAGIEGFREYFAVKALPNPRILEIMKDLGFGFDCSSIPELTSSTAVAYRAPVLLTSAGNTCPSSLIMKIDQRTCRMPS